MSHDFFDAPSLTDEEFRKRVSWAVRRGVPQWLWPNVSTYAWQDALKAIERVSRELLTVGKAVEHLQHDPDAIDVAGYTSGMGPLLGFWLSEGLISASNPTAKILARHYHHNSLRMKSLAQQTARVVARMSEHRVPVVVLKGLHTAFVCFPTLGTRPTSDIDLFVDLSYKDASQHILRDLGYSPEEQITLPDEQFWRHSSSTLTPQSLTFVHRNDPWGIDLHTSVNRRYAQGSPIIPMDELLTRVTPDGWPLNQHAQVMAPAANVLFLACHASCGFGNMRMMRLVEIVLLIRKAEQLGEFSWDEFIEIGELTATLQHAYAALLMASSLAPGTVPDYVLQRSRRAVPSQALNVVARLTPATAHAVGRCSVKERYMWTSSSSGKMRQLAHDIFPAELPRTKVLPAIKRRMRRVLRGTLTLGPSASGATNPNDPKEE